MNLRKFSQFMDKHFQAVTFAEAGLFSDAREILADSKSAKSSKNGKKVNPYIKSTQSFRSIAALKKA